MKTNKSVLILILGVLSAIGPFSIDTYLAGFPKIASDFNVSIDYVSYSLSSFFIGISVGQMLYGPLLDRFGRKTPLLIGLVVYLLASLGCAVSPSIEILIGLRFVQAVGGCVGMVAPRAIVRDLFPLHESAKVFSLLILILGVSPIIAPSVGSFMISALGWHSVFFLQAAMGLTLFLSVFFALQESKGPDETVSLKPRPITKTFWKVFTNTQFFTYAFAGSLVAAGLYAYVSGSPLVFMEIHGLTEQQYGWLFGFLASGLILSSQLNNLALKWFTSEQIVKVSIPLQVFFGILLVVLSLFDLHSIYSIVALLFLFFCCQGFSFPNSSALSLVPFSKEAGSASALMGALQMGFGALSSALVGVFADGTDLPMTAIIASFATLGLLVFVIGRRRIKTASGS
ncbi:multidrug effflux MFS transporter [Jiulongibacter sediminis]|uniref:multidrug effflux MFS transporter n=1 Tax=Jiulongibacter sediminis TaxID=1605367 RepID=UPI0026EEE34D|nr:multidrug effflux MFS transporter [Jiulongibacter sediminis]